MNQVNNDHVDLYEERSSAAADCSGPISESRLRSCVSQLAMSERGKNVLRATLAMLDDGGISLDANGQIALMTLLTASFTTHPGTARDLMREAI